MAGDIQGSVAFAPTAPSDFDVDGFGNARPAPTTQHGALDHLALRAKASEEAIVAEEASRIAADSALQTQADATDARTQPLTFAGDVLAVGSAGTSASLEVFGDMTVHGSTTTLHSTNLSVDDKTLQLARSDAPTDASADGAGIEVQGDSQKSFVWRQSTADGQSNAWQASGSLEVDDSLYVDPPPAHPGRQHGRRRRARRAALLGARGLRLRRRAAVRVGRPQRARGALEDHRGGLAAEIARSRPPSRPTPTRSPPRARPAPRFPAACSPTSTPRRPPAWPATRACRRASTPRLRGRRRRGQRGRRPGRRRRRGAERPRVRRRAAAAEH